MARLYKSPTGVFVVVISSASGTLGNCPKEPSAPHKDQPPVRGVRLVFLSGSPYIKYYESIPPILMNQPFTSSLGSISFNKAPFIPSAKAFVK